MLEEKEITVKDQNGVDRVYTISKFPAIAGREIIYKYPTSGLPKLGDYAENEAVMLKLMAYVAVDLNGRKQALVTKALIENHVPSWEVLVAIEKEMIAYNCSFFLDGRASTFLTDIMAMMRQAFTKISTGSSEQSSQPSKPPFTS